jgi:putative transcriptional regulator
MKAGRFARGAAVESTIASAARAKTGLSQSPFAHSIGVSVRTFQDWEQGRRNPTGAARTLLNIAIMHPETLLEAIAA